MKKSILRMAGLAAAVVMFCILYMTCNDSGAGSGKPDDRANEFVKKFNRPSESGSGNDSSHTVTPQHVHDWGEWGVTTEATCDAAGVETRSCTRGDSTETRPIPQLTGATCGTPHVHDWGEWKVTTEATCDAAGVETRSCTQGDSTETRPIPQLTGAGCNTGGGGSGNNNCTSAGSCKSAEMPDGKIWMTENLNIQTDSSWCYGYENSADSCAKYGSFLLLTRLIQILCKPPSRDYIY
jgi:hypothetical protein